ncbi:MAG: nitroreductase family protein [Bacteroidota bacterium]
MATKKINGHIHTRYNRDTYGLQEATQRSKDYYHWLDTRRTIRDISKKPVSRELIENLIMSGSTAPSGAHKQPWTFCAVADPEIKKAIKEAAEKEEYESYHGRMSERWLKDLKAFGTNWKKPFLEEAPWLVIVFKRVYELINGEKTNNYYVNESVGIACGMLISAIHNAGLVTLTHTPSPMNFLSKILKRPENERPYLLLPIGYPKNEVFVPDIKRKTLEEVAVFYD